MQSEDRAQVRADLMAVLDWPVTAGEVEAAAEQVTPQWRDATMVAAQRLPDKGHYMEINELWSVLDPLLKDVVHNT